MTKSIAIVKEIELVEKEMPSPLSLQKLADAVPDRPRYLTATDYGGVTDSLRNKGMTWREVEEWFRGNGVDLTSPAIIAGWRKWRGL